MKEYIMGIVVSALVISLLGAILPSGGIGDSVRHMFALLLLCAVASPMLNAIGGLGESIRDGIYDIEITEPERGELGGLLSELEATNRAEMEKVLTSLLERTFGKTGFSVEVRLTASTEGINVDGVLVTVSGRAALVAPEDIKELIGVYADAPCEVVNK